MGANANLGASRPTLPRPVRTVPPYHTGKVQIGIAYVPRQRPDHDRDALRLQDALLAGRQPRRSGNGFVLAAALALLAAVIGLLAA